MEAYSCIVVIASGTHEETSMRISTEGETIMKIKFRAIPEIIFASVVCLLLLTETSHADAIRIAKIGFAARLSDPLPQSALNGANLAIEEANRQTINTRNPIRFELFPQNDHGSANFAIGVANYFVKSQVSGIVGHWSSDAALATSKKYESAGIPQLNFTATSSKLTSQGYQTTFRVVGSTADIGLALADVALNKLGAEHAVVIGNDSTYSKAITEVFVKEMALKSGKSIPQTTVGSRTSDFNEALKFASENQPDMILFSAQIVQVKDFLQAVKRLNIKAKILLIGGASNEVYPQEDDGNLYVLEYETPHDECQKWRMFDKNYYSKYGHAPSTYSRYAYNATSMLIQTIRQIDSTDPAKIIPALHGMRYIGLTGEIAFDEAGNRVRPSYTLYHSKKTQWMPVSFFPSDAVPEKRCSKG